MLVKFRVYISALLLVVCFSAASYPVTRVATFKMLFHGFHIADIEDQAEFSPDGTYIFTSTVIPVKLASWLGLGEIQRTSAGLIDKQTKKLIVNEFTYAHKETSRRNIVNRNLNIISTANHSDIDISIWPEAEFVDSLSLIYLLYIFPERSSAKLSLAYTDGRRVKPYLLVPASEEEDIHVPAGLFRTIRHDREIDGRVSSIWHATDMDMFPVHVRITRPIGPFDLLLVSTSEITP